MTQPLVFADRGAKVTTPGVKLKSLTLHPRARGLASEIAVAVALVAVATLVRWLLGRLTPGVLPYALYFPAILIAALFGGWRAGLAALALSAVIGWWLFGRPTPELGAAAVVNLAIFVISMGAVFVSGAYTRAAVSRLRLSEQAAAQRNLLNETLFETMSEGFSLCGAICDAEGRLVDYTILEMNPALRKILGVGPEAIGTRFSDGPRRADWLKLCDRVIRTGTPARWEFHNPAIGRWHEIRIGRVTETMMAQFFIDITERKLAEARQGELFDELNHRVKNNLSMVSSFLHLQARSASPQAREELTKAVVRVQSIAQVHSALYRGARREDVDLGGYLHELCSGLATSLVSDDRVVIDVEAESLVAPVDTAVALGMVVTELVTNAAKYAYPPPTAGRIAVRLARRDGEIVLSVSDTGAGLNADGSGGREGLGLRLVGSLVEQVHGELAVSGPPGTTFDVRLPG